MPDVRVGSRKAWLLGLLAAAIMAATSALAQGKLTTLQIFTEDYPPMTFAEGGRASGLGSDLVREMIKRSPYDATIEVVPWSRGYGLAKTQPNVGLFVASRTAEREKIFKWIGPLSMTRANLYAKQSVSGPLSSIEDARSFGSIAVPREWYLHQILREKGFGNLYPVTDPAQCLKMLINDRTPAVALDEMTIYETARKAGFSLHDIKPIQNIVEIKQYLVFSRDTDDKIIDGLQHAFDTMRTDGTLTKLYQKWLPGVQPPPK